MTMKPLVHVVDDDAAIRDSLHALLSSIDLEVACYAMAQAFLDAPDSIQSGCILLDLRMPDMSGLEMQRVLRERRRSKPIIFLTGHGDVETTVRAMHQGATDVLTKPANEQELLEKIHNAIELSKFQQAEANRHSCIRARLELLSPRERQVLDGVTEGYTNKEIARRMRISHKTVELHRSNMMTKMHAHSLAEVVRMRMEVAEPVAKAG